MSITVDPAATEPGSEKLPRLALVDAWLEKFRSNEALVTVFYGGGTTDLVAPGTTLRGYLARILIANFPNQVQYSRDEGFTFPADNEEIAKAQREAFMRYSGADQQGGGSDDPTARLLGGAPQPGKLPRDPLAALKLIVTFLENAPRSKDGKRGTAMAVIDRMDFILPGASDTATMSAANLEILALLSRAGTSPQLSRSKNPLFITAPSLDDVHPVLRTTGASIPAIKVGLPTYEERLSYIQRKLAKGTATLADDLTPEQFAAQTAGLYRRHIEDIFLRAGTTPDKTITPAIVRAKKKEGIATQYAGVLEIIEPTTGREGIGGQQHFWKYVDRWILGPIRSGKANVMPKAIILSGPPGTGKTEAAKAVARETGWNVVLWRQGKLKGSLYGQAEKNQAMAFEGVEALAPVLVVADEADQQFRRLTGGGGGAADAADATLFGGTLEFIEDPAHQDRVIWFLMSNRPDQLDGALVSRADVRVPILPPETVEARADILTKMLRRSGVAENDIATSPGPIVTAAEIMDGWSGRDMIQAVKKAVGVAELDDLSIGEALVEAARTRRPLERADADEMTKLAVQECNDVDLLPEKYRDARFDAKQLKKEIFQIRRQEDRTVADIDL